MPPAAATRPRSARPARAAAPDRRWRAARPRHRAPPHPNPQRRRAARFLVGFRDRAQARQHGTAACGSEEGLLERAARAPRRQQQRDVGEIQGPGGAARGGEIAVEEGAREICEERSPGRHGVDAPRQPRTRSAGVVAALSRRPHVRPPLRVRERLRRADVHPEAVETDAEEPPAIYSAVPEVVERETPGGASSKRRGCAIDTPANTYGASSRSGRRRRRPLASMRKSPRPV